ncbi:MAG: glucose-6-phosphate isomerase, partial [Gammaproteobacteria bacterium]
MRLTELPVWQALRQDAARVRECRTDSLFAQDPERLSRLSFDAARLHVDLSKNPLDQAALDNLLVLATERHLDAAIVALFTGKHVNVSEDRPALHMLLRTPAGASVDPALAERHAEVIRVKQQLAGLAARVIDGELRGFSGEPVRDVVNLGIGGSHLGPQVVCEALRANRNTNIGVHFVSNVDGGDIESVLGGLNPATTLFIVASKSFTTAETLLNARTARTWLRQHATDPDAIAAQFVAVTSQPARALEFGVAEDNVFPMWDWVGGRYSLWSAIGLSIALSIGVDGFERLLAGAHAMDEHFRTTAPANNVPVMLGLMAIWNNNFIGCDSLAIVPYDDRLYRLTEYLQQLEMESNGKRVTSDG